MTRRLNNNLAALAAILILINRIGFEEAFSRSQKSPNISPISFLGRLRRISIRVKIYYRGETDELLEIIEEVE